MSHLVVFKSPEGKQAYHQASSLEDAVKFLEHLRNSEGVEKAKLFKLTEIPVEFKAYFKLELGSGSGPAPASAEEPVDEVEEPEPETNGELVDAGSKRGLFGR